ncbi:hypothetical protein KOI40_02075 [Aestuariicella sp. G3-2]|uniref:hypothetical protein n=1 Tax=Pseudomaricurvus albidus TaxID=2842452 RepID=UPI001C0B43AF|nr:hypothetical protein [Aestuariicella albida]MBU3068585.1 hypothetical protein [Aestuariicella albida]
MFWSPSRGLHPLRSYEAVDRVEELSIELPCPACGVQLELQDSLSKARNIRCAECKVAFDWSPKKGVSLPNDMEETRPQKNVSESSDDIGTMPCPGCAQNLEFPVKDDACIRCHCGLCLHWAAQSGLKLTEKQEEKQILLQGNYYALPEPGTYTLLHDLKLSSVGGLGKFFGGFLVALIVSLVGLVLLWNPAGIKKIAVISVFMAFVSGIATLVLADRKRWRVSGVFAGLLLVLNPLTLTLFKDQGYGDLSKSFWGLFSSGPDYEALAAEAETLAGQARRALNQGDYQQGLNKLSEATMSASLGKDIKLAEQLLEELIHADKKQ